MESSAGKSLSCFLAAKACYGGAFLEEDPFEDWCMGQRQSLKLQYIEVLFLILRVYEEKQDNKKCISYSKIILETDLYNDEIYRKIMGFYAGAGNIANVKKIYEDYQQMVAEIDCPVSHDTKKLCENLIQNNKNNQKI